RLDAERARAGAHAVDDDVVGTGRDVRHHGDLRRPRRRDVRARLPRAGLARLRDLDRRIEPADVLDLDDEIDGDERARHVDRVDAIVAGRLRAGGGEGVARGRAVGGRRGQREGRRRRRAWGRVDRWGGVHGGRVDGRGRIDERRVGRARVDLGAGRQGRRAERARPENGQAGEAKQYVTILERRLGHVE